MFSLPHLTARAALFQWAAKLSRGWPGCYPAPLLRSAFVLREMEGLSTEEAAQQLSVTANTLKA